MVRYLGGACALLALVLLTAGSAQAQKAQMVKGTIKLIDPTKSLLVISQKVKNENVDRELSILDSTEIVVMSAAGKKDGVGKDAMRLLEGQTGASVAVKCDKDVNVLKVTVTVKK